MSIKNWGRQKRANQGITLIALVVTIIILLILAGITILTLTGENGILGKSKTAKEENNKQTATEIMTLKITNAQMQSYAETKKMLTLQYLANKLCEDNDIDYVELTTQTKKQANIDKTLLPLITVPEKGSIFTKLKEYPYEFEINSSLQLESVDGIKIANNTNMISKEEYDKLLKNYQQLEKDYKDATSTVSSALNDIGIETNDTDTISSLSEKIKNIHIPRITKLSLTGVGYEYSNIYRFNISSYDNYKNLTLDNLSIQLNTTPFRATQLSDACGYLYYTFAYTPETGIITVTLAGGTVDHQSWSTPAPAANITIID